MDSKLASALDGLRDIHLPPPVPFWPLAPGWWALAAVLLLTGVTVAVWRRRRRRSTRRAALGELEELARRFARDADPAALAVALTTLLRRVALARSRPAPAEAAPSPDGVGAHQRAIGVLHGEPWIAYLTEGRAQDGPVARELVRHAYAGPGAGVAADPKTWLAFVRTFIREVA